MERGIQEEWRIYGKKADFEAIGKRFGISPYLARLIRNRDVKGEAGISCYLNGTLTDLEQPEKMKDMEKAVNMLLAAVQRGQRIRIIGDYDADGVCSIAILYRSLCAVGAQTDWTIPDRIRDGYGLNLSFVEEAAADGIELLVTCDNGIAALEPVARARELGMHVIVTDHHELPRRETDGSEAAVVPEADAVVNPKQPDCSYPYKGLCGAGIVWKLAGLLLEKAKIASAEKEKLLGELLEYAAIATVADVCDLTGENRILVKEGIKRLRRTEQPGLSALMERQQVKREALSSYHIGFILGPALNAGGRLDTARTAVRLLLTRDPEEAGQLAGRLKELNDRRKEMTAAGVQEAQQILEESGRNADRVLVVFLPDCHESLAGIIAGRLREIYGKPAIVLTRGANGLKGSGRSIETYQMFQRLNDCAEFLDRFGGHPMAAGLSLQENQLEPFRCALNERCGLTDKDLVQKVWIDMVLPFEYVDLPLIREIEQLEPFGKGNPKPVFAERNVEVLNIRVVGKNRNVLRLSLRNASGCRMDAVFFGDTDDFFENVERTYGAEEVMRARQGRTNALRFHITYYPEVDTYGGRECPQIVLTRFKLLKKP